MASEKPQAKVDGLKSVEADATALPVCGIVMPISAMFDTYSVEHWRRVRKIIERAITQANMRPQLVWENPESDIIQTKILQNIYENDVVICDLSALNSNVMLETGLRLSTKKPTVIITDEVVKPPFDIGTISYIPYQRDLEYNSTDDFIARLSTHLELVYKAAKANTYKSFVENYHFETVTPVTVNVTSEKFILDRLEAVSGSIERLTREVSELTRTNSVDYAAGLWSADNASTSSINPLLAMSLQARLSAKLANDYRDDVGRTGIAAISAIEKEGTDSYTFRLRFRDGESEAKIRNVRKSLMAAIRAYETRYLTDLTREN